VGFPDVLQSRGEYQLRPGLPFTPGWEVSGVVRTGNAVVPPGTRVAAMPMLGGFAERVAFDTHMVLPLPDEVPFATGAALPLNYLTAHLALVRRGELKNGDTVLVHGAAGGVGSAACSMAAALGARVIAVVSAADKSQTAKAAGAHDVVLAEGFRQEVGRLTAGRGADLVVDPVGGDRFTDSLRCLALEGKLLVGGSPAVTSRPYGPTGSCSPTPVWSAWQPGGQAFEDATVRARKACPSGHGGGLAGTVRAEQGGDGSGRDGEADPVEDAAGAGPCLRRP
jgi:NADPH:quinone reductase-like Zn-dependent oxidoreductase